jgi:hypothetical protein
MHWRDASATRPPAYGSGSGRLARPFLHDSFIRNSKPVIPALSIPAFPLPTPAISNGPGEAPLVDDTYAGLGTLSLYNSAWVADSVQQAQRERPLELIAEAEEIGMSGAVAFTGSSGFALKESLLSLAEVCPVDLQLPHAGAESVRIDLQQRRRAVASLNPAVGGPQGCLNVSAYHLIKRADVW